MTRDILIGLDAGTSMIKAVAFTLDGEEIAVAGQRNRIDRLPDGGVEQDQIAALRASRGRVESGETRRCLDEVRRAAARSQNLVGPLLQAAHARASVGELMNALADVFGRYGATSV